MQPGELTMSRIVEPQDETALNGSPHEVVKPPKSKNIAARIRPSQKFAEPEFWSDAAPRRLRKGGLELSAAWEAFCDKRRSPSSVARLVHAIGTPLAWGVNCSALREESRALVDIADELDRGGSVDRYNKGKRQARLREAIQLWLDGARDGDTNVSFALGCLAAAHVLDRLGGPLGSDDAWQLVDFLYATAQDAQGWEAKPTATADSALAQQLLACELPLTLAYLFPEMKPLAKLARAGRNGVADGFASLLGDRGMLHASQLPALLGLIACWTRCRAIGTQLTKAAWSQETQQQFETAFRQSLRWTDANGVPLLAAPSAKAWTPDFLAAAHRFGGRKRDAAAARGLLGKAGLAGEVPAAGVQPPRPSVYAERARLAVLRASWAPAAATIAIDYSGPGMRLDTSAAAQRLFQGVWTATSSADGKLLKPTSAWDVTCWFTDKDVDYIEFRMELEEGARLERQILLARKDQFILLADHLKTTTSAALEHSWKLPLAENMAWNSTDETREAVISSEQLSVRVLPLALPEWRIDPRMGDLTSGEGVMQLSQRTTARAMACPVFIDLKPGRSSKPCTWRQLTVAEALQIQPPDVAVGYRVQCGRKQWLFYRSLAERGNRTVLGQNTSAEFLAARFLAPAGDVEELILVEA
jgi:hypothetical protein